MAAFQAARVGDAAELKRLLVASWIEAKDDPRRWEELLPLEHDLATNRDGLMDSAPRRPAGPRGHGVQRRQALCQPQENARDELVDSRCPPHGQSAPAQGQRAARRRLHHWPSSAHSRPSPSLRLCCQHRSAGRARAARHLSRPRSPRAGGHTRAVHGCVPCRVCSKSRESAIDPRAHQIRPTKS